MARARVLAPTGCLARLLLAALPFLADPVAGSPAAAAAANITSVVLTIESPPGVAGVDIVYTASFSARAPQGPLLLWLPAAGADLGCDALPPAPAASAVLLRRGVCPFSEKARRAQEAGASAALVVSDGAAPLLMESNQSSTELGLDIFVASVGNATGKQLLDWAREHPDQPVKLSFEPYVMQIWNVAEVILILMATCLVVAGAYFATADLRTNSPLAPKVREEVVDVDVESAVGFCGMGSLMLVVLFFFMNKMIYFIIFAFCMGGFSCILQIGSAILVSLAPDLGKRKFSLPLIGRVTMADLLAAVPAAAIVTGWFILRNTPHGWILQDIIGAGFLCWMQRTLRLPNMKVATVLLSVMFFFDIFWVFLSPLFFGGKSVMVTVAKGGGTGESVPMLLRIPSFGDPLGSERMLGFGDVALPGLLISYLRRFDVLSGRSGCAGYFVPSVVGYLCGLVATVMALSIMKMGQPALLYLVPGTLGTTLLLGCARNEMRQLWEGRPGAIASAAEEYASSAEDQP
eukprot:TRINITY_DN46033_c0_g1_i1.p1 TRINITY_DN46033_c0_g1~~TRINITY_DN46033_c0_g1_i1.p1  ORF type:complete len:518 (-),score=122.12 TRINITY_DN46033_c0_g1_i1:133-1686(-)